MDTGQLGFALLMMQNMMQKTECNGNQVVKLFFLFQSAHHPASWQPKMINKNPYVKTLTEYNKL